MNPLRFSDAKPQLSDELIAAGTALKVILHINPGGYSDPNLGISHGLATEGKSGSIFLKGEFTVLAGPYAKRKIFTMIGLFSPNGEAWHQMGRTMIRAMLESAYQVLPSDQSEQADQKRTIASYDQLNGLEFVVRVAVETDPQGKPRNCIQRIVTPDQEPYQSCMASENQPMPQRSQPVQQQSTMPRGRYPSSGYSTPGQEW